MFSSDELIIGKKVRKSIRGTGSTYSELKENPNYNEETDSFNRSILTNLSYIELIEEQLNKLSDFKGALEFDHATGEKLSSFEIDAEISNSSVRVQAKKLNDSIRRYNKNVKSLNQASKKCTSFTRELEGEKKKADVNQRVLSDAEVLITSLVESEHTECPICETEFLAKDLIKTIKSKQKKNFSNLISSLEKEISQLNETMNDLNTKNDIIFKSIIGHVNTLGSVLEEDETDLKKENALSKEILKKIKKVDADIKKKTNEFKELCEKVELSEFFLTNGFAKTLVSARQNELKLEKKIEQKHSEVKLDKEKYSRSLQNHDKMKLELDKARDTKYLTYLEAIKKLQLEITDEDFPSKLKALVSKASKESVEVNKKIKSLGTQLSKIDDLKKLATDIKKLEKDASECKKNISSLEAWTSNYTSIVKFNKFSPDDLSQSFFKSLISENEKKRKLYQDIIVGLKNLTLISIELNKLEKFNPLRDELKEVNEQIEIISKELENLNQKKVLISNLKKNIPVVLKNKIKENLDQKLFQLLYKNLNPHQRFSNVSLGVSVKNNNIGLTLDAKGEGVRGKPEYLFSSAQLNTLGVCIFLSMALRQNWLNLDTIFLDDPVQNLDDINILSLIDLIRIIVEENKKQIFISTHDERLCNLLKKKLHGFRCKFIDFTSYGKVEITSNWEKSA